MCIVRGHFHCLDSLSMAVLDDALAKVSSIPEDPEEEGEGEAHDEP